MAKKIALALLIAAMVTGGAFAIDLSAGIGGTFTANFQTFSWGEDGKKYRESLNSADFTEDVYDMNLIGGGFFAFFDASYVMASLGMGFYDISPADENRKKRWEENKRSQSLTMFEIGLYGKFPIELDSFTLFPFLGADFRIAVSQTIKQDGKTYKYGETYDGVKQVATDKDGNEYSLNDVAGHVMFKLGIGADIPLGDKMYLRPMISYGVGTLSKATKEGQEEDNKDQDWGKLIHHGLDVKLALGFKF